MARALNRVWSLHGDGRTVGPAEVVLPDERLRMPNMLGLGAQHVLAMFGSTALVPVPTGFPVTTTIFFSRVGTLLFNLMTRNPSYTGSSFAFIAPGHRREVARRNTGGWAASCAPGRRCSSSA